MRCSTQSPGKRRTHWHYVLQNSTAAVQNSITVKKRTSNTYLLMTGGAIGTDLSSRQWSTGGPGWPLWGAFGNRDAIKAFDVVHLGDLLCCNEQKGHDCPTVTYSNLVQKSERRRAY